MKVNYERRNQEKEYVLESWPEGSPTEIRDYLTAIEAEYGKDIVIVSRWSGYEDCEYVVTKTIWETDEEMNARIAFEENEARKEAERKTKAKKIAEEKKRKKLAARKDQILRELSKIEKQQAEDGDEKNR